MTAAHTKPCYCCVTCLTYTYQPDSHSHAECYCFSRINSGLSLSPGADPAVDSTSSYRQPRAPPQPSPSSSLCLTESTHVQPRPRRRSASLPFSTPHSFDATSSKQNSHQPHVSESTKTDRPGTRRRPRFRRAAKEELFTCLSVSIHMK